MGQHPLVIRIMKGIKWSRPPKPKYKMFWDVNKVLSYVISLGPNESLSLKVLSAKLALLLCLVALKRASDIRALEISRRTFIPGGVRFELSRRTKTGISSIFFPAFVEDPGLCVVQCLREYEVRTSSLRSNSGDQLLISFVHPHNPISPATLARWIRWLIGQARVDTSIFGAHLVRVLWLVKLLAWAHVWRIFSIWRTGLSLLPSPDFIIGRFNQFVPRRFSVRL
nr:PREDICTED: uncharacterized protein LOC106703957 [Latimeria chalumnae]|eukprot:XP_014345421.1 PREDICTED: uncharacterized protein LOC106703957 [Latimeria chalumnae]